MDEHSDLVDRADALMRPDGPAARRRRSFVATGRPEEADGLALAVIEDDLPLLTEVVSDEETLAEARPDRIDETLLAVIAADLVRTLQQQVAIELPTLIEASLLSAQDELRKGINSTLEFALQNFLARRQQLRLPFDDPDSGR
jgi:hypothetical protein